MPPAGAPAVAFSRWVRGVSMHDVPHRELVKDLLDLYAEPLRSALRIRQRLISDYHVHPSRIRITHATSGARDVNYISSRWLRAHLFTLNRVRDRPLET